MRDFIHFCPDCNTHLIAEAEIISKNKTKTKFELNVLLVDSVDNLSNSCGNCGHIFSEREIGQLEEQFKQTVENEK